MSEVHPEGRSLPYRNCGKAFSSPIYELNYRFLPWNPEMENFVGAPTGIEPASPAFRAGVLTTTPQHPGTKCIKFASSNHPWQMVLRCYYYSVYTLSQVATRYLLILMLGPENFHKPWALISRVLIDCNLCKIKREVTSQYG